MATEVLRGLILKEPLLIVLLSVEQLVHLVLFSFNFICDLLGVFERNLARYLVAHIDGEELFGARLDAEEVRLIQCQLPLSYGVKC